MRQLSLSGKIYQSLKTNITQDGQFLHQEIMKAGSLQEEASKRSSNPKQAREQALLMGEVDQTI